MQNTKLEQKFRKFGFYYFVGLMTINLKMCRFFFAASISFTFYSSFWKTNHSHIAAKCLIRDENDDHDDGDKIDGLNCWRFQIDWIWQWRWVKVCDGSKWCLNDGWKFSESTKPSSLLHLIFLLSFQFRCTWGFSKKKAFVLQAW